MTHSLILFPSVLFFLYVKDLARRLIILRGLFRRLGGDPMSEGVLEYRVER
jgi:hypothetical protein